MDFSDALNKLEELFMKLDLHEGRCEDWGSFRDEVAAALVRLDEGVETIWKYEGLSK